MGQGRQRAKQAKVARDLKYRTSATDLQALQHELSSHRSGSSDEGLRDRSDSSGSDDLGHGAS